MTVLAGAGPPAPPGEAARAVLLVEDNPGDARLVSEMLRRSTFGTFEVTHVTTLADAVRLLAEASYTCVLLDLSLPDAVALEGLRAIRAAHPVLPVVVLTGGPEAGAYGALGAGAQDFLVKGDVDSALLARTLRYAVERGRAESALLDRDRKLAAAHLLARMGAWEWDLTTGTMLWSPELCEVLGLAPEEAPTTVQGLLALVHQDDWATVGSMFDRVRAVDGRFAFEARFVMPRGVVWTRHAGEVRRVGGRVTAVFGTVQDVTHLERAEAALRSSERRYRTILETAQEGVWMVDAGHVTTFVNQRMADLLGYAPEEVVGRHLREFLDDDVWSGAVGTLERVRAGEPAQGDVRLRRKDGAPLYVIASASPLCGDDGGYAGAVAMVNDITDRHLEEERLRLDHDVVLALTGAAGIDAALAAVLRRAAPAVGAPYVEVWHRPAGGRLLEPGPVFYVADGSYAALRRSTEAVRLAPGEDVVGTAWSSRSVCTGPWSADPARVAAAREHGLRSAYVMPVVANDAVYAVVVWHLPEARPGAYPLDLLDDIRKRLQDYGLRWQVEQMKDAFLTAVSHELRTPLTALIGHATTLQRHNSRLDQALHDECVSGVVRSAAKLNVMLSDLLDVDRLSRGVVEPRRHVVRLDELVRSVVEGFDPDGERTVVETAECVARVDPPKVERIVENLLANAVKYVPAGTSITVRLTTDGEVALLAVDDHGAGVPDELKSLVFEPFRRGENLADHAPGTGVGLSLVAGFARLHGGHAWVEDRPGGGSSFRVSLPLAPAPAPLP